jgi:hypothetical protein
MKYLCVNSPYKAVKYCFMNGYDLTSQYAVMFVDRCLNTESMHGTQKNVRTLRTEWSCKDAKICLHLIATIHIHFMPCY